MTRTVKIDEPRRVIQLAVVRCMRAVELSLLDEEKVGTTRPVIRAAWTRALGAGVVPTKALDRVPLVDYDGAGPLLAAAEPVLAEIEDELSGTNFCVVLADENAIIVDRRFGTTAIGAALDAVHAIPGAHYAEQITGTNSIATPFELRHGITVNGREHLVDDLKRFNCYGQPIFHPLTRRIAGVLDITGPAREANPLFAPFVSRAVTEIQSRLLAGVRVEERRLLAAFELAVARKRHAVVVLGADLILANPAAVDALDAADHAVLRELLHDLPRKGFHEKEFQLSSGRLVSLTAVAIPRTRGCLVELVPVEHRTVVVPRSRNAYLSVGERMESHLRLGREDRASVLFHGEPGTGRSTAARRLAGTQPVAFFEAEELARVPENDWLRGIDAALGRPDELLVVASIHLTSPLVARYLKRRLQVASAWFALTSIPCSQLTDEHAALAACCERRVAMPPLRDRRDELPNLIQWIQAEIAPRSQVRFTPTILGSLAGQSWPGNLDELRSVVAYVLARRSTGDATLGDLPPDYRTRPQRSLTVMQQAERDAILTALRNARGNKAHAADHLGISRSTLYRRLRALGIAQPAAD